jgi:glycine/D-amino acid oxidase-like deaminating enzyme
MPKMAESQPPVPDRSHYDVVIAGGGAIGSAIAYFLVSNNDFGGAVLVVEPDATYQRASSALTVGGIRHQFSTVVNIQISQFGTEFLREFGNYVNVDGDYPEIGFQEGGYLFLATDSGLAGLRDTHRTQTACGVDVVIYERDDLRAEFPYLDVSEVAAGSYGRSGEGWFDGYALLQGLRKKAQHLGAEYCSTAVTGLQCGDNAVGSVMLGCGKRVSCGVLVNAAGTNAARLTEMAGFSIPVERRKRCIFVVDAQKPIVGTVPHTIDHSGVFWRAEGQYYITGVSPSKDPAVRHDDFDVEHAEFSDDAWPRLLSRVPQFDALKVMTAWAGHYAYNTLDQNAILGPHDRLQNFILANGFSGHGLQQAPAVGRGINELITYGEYRSLDLTPLTYDRIQRGEGLFESLVF